MNANQPIGEEEETPPQSQSSKIIALTLASPGVKKHVEKRNYASVAASKPATPPEQPWTQISYKNRKSNLLKYTTGK